MKHQPPRGGVLIFLWCYIKMGGLLGKPDNDNDIKRKTTILKNINKLTEVNIDTILKNIADDDESDLEENMYSEATYKKNELSKIKIRFIKYEILPVLQYIYTEYTFKQVNTVSNGINRLLDAIITLKISYNALTTIEYLEDERNSLFEQMLQSQSIKFDLIKDPIKTLDQQSIEFDLMGDKDRYFQKMLVKESNDNKLKAQGKEISKKVQKNKKLLDDLKNNDDNRDNETHIENILEKENLKASEIFKILKDKCSSKIDILSNHTSNVEGLRTQLFTSYEGKKEMSKNFIDFLIKNSTDKSSSNTMNNICSMIKTEIFSLD